MEFKIVLTSLKLWGYLVLIFSAISFLVGDKSISSQCLYLSFAALGGRHFLETIKDNLKK